MKNSLLPVVSLSICTLIPAASFAAGKKATSCDGAAGVNINVTSTFFSTDANTQPFQLQPDSQGSYTTLTNSRNDSVSSVIQATSCDWVLDMSNSQNRTISLTLAYPYSSSPTPTPPFTGPTNVAARIISKCNNNHNNNGISYGTMTYNQTLECALYARFDYSDGNTYAISMDPFSFPETKWVQVTCIGAPSSQCTSWTVTPLPWASGGVTNLQTNQISGLGQLVRITTKGKTTETPLGLYYVDFSASIVKLP